MELLINIQGTALVLMLAIIFVAYFFADYTPDFGMLIGVLLFFASVAALAISTIIRIWI